MIPEKKLENGFSLPVFSMRRRKNLLENLGALDWTTEPADIEELRSTFPGQKKISDREPLL
ncbi:hypothetical protein [Desulfomarina sp.]